MKSVAIVTGPASHLDHLGVLSILLQIPLIVTCRENYLLTKRYYPKADVEYLDHNEVTLDFLAQYDVIFHTGKFWAIQLQPMIDLLYQKRVRFVYCPHGNSDKERIQTEHVAQDLSLVYGEHMIDLLQETGAMQKIDEIVRTGNYRLSYFASEKEFYDQEISPLFKGRLDKRCILFAPTWEKNRDHCSFLLHCQNLIEDLSDHDFLVVKLHPFIAEFHPGLSTHLIHRYQDKSNVLFLEEMPIVYPLLEKVDLLIGDYSSLCYDFLYFDKPMFFFNPHQRKNFPLQQCGREIPSEEEKNPISYINRCLANKQISFSDKRKDLYQYAFGQDLPRGEREINIRNEITLKLLQEPRSNDQIGLQ